MRRATTAILAVLLLAACTKQADQAPPPVIKANWQQVSLPAPQAPFTRVILRESVVCAGKTYLLGGVGNPAAAVGDATEGQYGVDTKPAVWVTADGTQWKPVTLNPKDYYGERSILYSAACREGKIAILGSKTGGAHGNPRVSTWYQQDDGSLIQVVAHFELYNGPNYMNVTRMVSGPKGWLIAGNRTGGAAVWLSPDAHKFEIVEDAPNLANDQGITWGADAIATPDGWMVVGGYLPKGRIDRDPATWTSPDGLTWTRNLLAGTGQYEELQRVTGSGGDFWATGLHGQTFGAWHYINGKWEQTATFATLGGASAPQVKSLITLQKGLATAGVTGTGHEIWGSPDGKTWRQAELPAPAPAGAERTISINAIDQRILLIIDDGQLGKAWFGTLSVTF